LAFALALLLALLFAGSAHAATASWSIEPATWEFGTVIVESGPSVPQPFTLTNTGETTLAPGLLTLTEEGGSGFNLAGNTCHSSLPAGAECTIKVRFEPVNPGYQTAELSMLEAHSEVAPAVGNLSGTGAGPVAELSPPTLEFGRIELGSTPPQQTAMLANSGLADLSVASVTVETNSFTEGDLREQFRLGGGSCAPAVVVAPGGSCSVVVEFTPTEPFGTGGHLVIADSAPDSPQRVKLLGAGAPVQLSLAPHSPSLVHHASWVRSVSWGYVGTSGPRILLARVKVASCVGRSPPTISSEVLEKQNSSVVTLLARVPAEDRLEWSGCQRVKIRRVVRVRLKRPVAGLDLYDGSRKPPYLRHQST
jgi:hypothetical protein